MKSVAPLMLIATIAACNSQPAVTATNASTAEVAAKAADAIRIEPGNWKTSVQMLDMQMAGGTDPRVAEAMKQAMKSHGSAVREFDYCVTPEEAAKPKAEMFAGKDNGECRYDSFTMAGGKIASKMTCQQGGGKMVMTMNGTYSSTAYAMTAEMNGIGSGADNKQSMTMKLQTSAKRTGECTATTKGTT